MVNREEKRYSKDRFMPSLLRRLIDNNPEQKKENYTIGVVLKELKEDILWNIELILNSRSHPSLADLNYDMEVANSVLGMGLADFCGSSCNLEQKEKIKEELLQQLKQFEPRLIADTLEINFIDDKELEGEKFIIKFEIRALVKMDRLQTPLVLRTQLDLESGCVNVNLMS